MKKHENKSHIKKEKIDKYKKIDLATLRPPYFHVRILYAIIAMVTMNIFRIESLNRKRF